jgi:hypothetical protein
VRAELQFEATRSSGRVSAILIHPPGARHLLMLAHGAGAGIHHPFLEDMAAHLASLGVASMRFQFPYMEQGRRRPDPQPVLLKSVRSAVRCAAEAAPGVRLLAGGKSLGGRMVSLAAWQEPLPSVEGLVFLGFPLHAPGRPSTERADHLQAVNVPMLFLQGTRDSLARLDLMTEVVRRLGRGAELRVYEQADHSFRVPKRLASEPDLRPALADAIARWARRLPATAGGQG